MTELVGQGKPFYSAMDMGAKALKRKVGTGSEFLKELMALPGVKPTELKERGLEGLMNEPKMTHEDFLRHLENKSAPKIQEKVLGEVPELPPKEVLRKKANQLIRKSATDYANMVAHTSGEYRRLAADEMRRFRALHMAQAMRIATEQSQERGEPTYHQRWTLPGGENYREMLIKQPGKDVFANPNHYNDEPNILASMRLKDRKGPNGEKLLHLEELQSDWHQEGRENGYSTEFPKNMDSGDLLWEYGNRMHPAQQKWLRDFGERWELADPETEHPKMVDEYTHWLNTNKTHQTPDAPFKKNWEEMAIKRLIHHAAQKGYHGIVVTPGLAQAERYGLSKNLHQVHVYKDKNGKYTLSGYIHGQDTTDNPEIEHSDISEEKLKDYIGHDLAKKAIEKGGGDFQGLDLDVGGEGMKGFYDKKVPNIFNAVGKKHGVQMQLHGHNLRGAPKDAMIVSHFPRGEEYVRGQINWPEMVQANPELADKFDTKLHHFPITEPMRQDVLKNGLPLYNTGGVIHKAEGGNVQPSIEQMRMALNQNRYMVPKADIQSIGANEAPSMQNKVFINPGQNGNPPVGGVDMDAIAPGMQMMKQDAPPMTPPNQQPPSGQPQQSPLGGNVTSPLGAPPSNILQMTPQGQAMNAMTPPQQLQPPRMASGGSMHYAPSRPLSQSEISAMAERMVRQSQGLEMPSTTTKQQFEREKNLPIDIRKSGKEIQQPIIDYSQHIGASSVGVPGDPSRGGLVPSTNKKGFPVAKAGETLRGIGGQKLEKPVGLFGGYKYGAYGHPKGWASDLGASAGMFNVVKKLAEENPDAEILGHFHKMTPESLHHAVHMLQTVLSHHQPHNLNDEHIALLDHLMKKVAITKGKNDIPYPEFPGFKNPEEVILHGSLKSGMRKKIIKLLGTEKYFPGGKQKMDDIMYAISHPELRNMETGSGGSAIIRFDPLGDLKNTLSLHPTYGNDIPSKLIGRTRYITPAQILAPRSMANAEREIKAMGKKVVPFNQAKMNIIREPIDEQYVNQMGEYEHEMKKRLGYKKGGKVSDNLDSMRLALSKKSNKAKK